jgi:DNA-binding response OmpR family regulator
MKILTAMAETVRARQRLPDAAGGLGWDDEEVMPRSLSVTCPTHHEVNGLPTFGQLARMLRLVGMGQALIVDGDGAFRALAARHLAELGFEVVELAEGRPLLAALEASPVDLVVLDLQLPDMDGFDLLRLLRSASDVPVIIATSRSADADRITGLDLGADDYVVKPCSLGELMARVRAVRRRLPPAAEGGLQFDDLLIDRRTREVRVRNARVALTHREFDLLAFLASSPGQVFSREQLLDRVWGSSSDWQDPKTVTEHIRRLRLKLGSDNDAKWIRTVHGVGYAFAG